METTDCEQPPAKAGGFELRLKAGLFSLKAAYKTLKSSSGSSGFWSSIYLAQS